MITKPSETSFVAIFNYYDNRIYLVAKTLDIKWAC